MKQDYEKRNWDETIGYYVSIATIIALGIVFLNFYYKILQHTKQVRTSTYFEGVINKKDHYKGSALVQLDTVKTYWIIPCSYNYQYDPKEIDIFLKKGDYLLKKEGNDTLYVKRNNSTYVFFIGDITFNRKE